MYIIMDGDKTFRNHGRAVENKYILSKHYADTKTDSVYFKENNDIKGFTIMLLLRLLKMVRLILLAKKRLVYLTTMLPLL